MSERSKQTSRVKDYTETHAPRGALRFRLQLLRDTLPKTPGKPTLRISSGMPGDTQSQKWRETDKVLQAEEVKETQN